MAAGGVAALATGLIGPGAATAVPAEGEIVNAHAAGAIKDRYIVVLKDNAEARKPGIARKLADRFGGTVRDEYGTAVHGFTANLTEKAAKRLAANSNVASVEQDRSVLKEIGRRFGGRLALDAAVVRGGTVRLGDAVSHESSGDITSTGAQSAA